MHITVNAGQSIPPRPDGTRWPLVALYPAADDGVYICADTYTELLGGIIDGYTGIPATPEGDERALIARYDHAVRAATLAQASIAASEARVGRFDPNEESEDVLTALFTERTEPFTGTADGDSGVAVEWKHRIPLVLIESDYEPFVPERPRPTGNIAWIRPVKENEYVNSLAELGLLRLWVES